MKLSFFLLFSIAALKVVLNVESSNLNLLTQQMSSLGQSQMNTGDGSTVFVAPTQPMSTPLRPPAPNATPFCSPTGYGMFGSGNVSIWIQERSILFIDFHFCW